MSAARVSPAPSPAPTVRPPALVRGVAVGALGIAFLHVVFGAIVRISGSGMGCGDNWPRCADPATGRLYWVPPFSQPTLVIEWTHRLLAAILISAVVALAALAFARRREAGVAGPGGVLRSAALAFGAVVATAAFGAVTVFAGNPAWATVVHKLLAATVLGSLAAAAFRAGVRPALAAAATPGTAKAARGATVGAGLALTAVVLGGLTAKVTGAVAACQGFPFCSAAFDGGRAHIQLTHRVVAYLLALHVLGLAMAFAKRRESPVVTAAARLALGIVGLQIALGAAMVTGHYTAVLRSAHQATGIALWLATFATAYLARVAAGATVPAFARPNGQPDAAAPTRGALAGVPAPGVPAAGGVA